MNTDKTQIMNWKFWTWPGQIVALKQKLATAAAVIERQRAELLRQKQHNRGVFHH